MVKALKRRQRSTSTVFAVGAVLLLVLAGCSSDDPAGTPADNTAPATGGQVEGTQDPVELNEGPDEPDFFELTIDGEHLEGSGLVFRNGNELSLRGFLGAEMDHLQLDLTANGFGEQTPTIVGPVVSRVIGLDASETTYELVDDAGNRLSINERGPALTVWGDFSILALDVTSGEQVTISGDFDVPVGNGDWDCDWNAEPPACGFIS